ncbi:MAG: amidohydrolase [Synergistaceae bacterium]|jgi:amidohydrolase|nr:amidohydrolase [Synergistaceae bacterium]
MNEKIKEELFANIERNAPDLISMADMICDNPEVGLEEYKASGWLSAYLADRGFSVETGIGGLETAFKGTRSFCGGVSLGLLCEYDALEGIGHGCGHHIQGPAVCGCAAALADVMGAFADLHPFTVIVYGTPAEETVGGKVTMLGNGCFRDIDVAIMTHASSSGTSVDNRTLAMSSYIVRFQGIGSHAAIAPEKGRSALDAFLLAASGVEFMREHVPPDVRMHYTITGDTGPVNVVHESASAKFTLRSYSRETLDGVKNRFEKIIRGASLMTGADCAVQEVVSYDDAVPVDSLAGLLMENARFVGAPDIRPPRERTGSTDFGNVSRLIPGACLRVASDGEGHVPGHSREAAALGKSDENHDAIIVAAKVISAACCDLIMSPPKMEEIKKEFEEKRRGQVNADG